VNDSRDAFVEKFRANLRARVQSLLGMLEILRQMPHNGDASTQVLGELHTLKGEARLLGLVPLAELAHALETLLGSVNERTIAAAEESLGEMGRALMDHVSRESADALLETTLGRLERVINTSESTEQVEPVVTQAECPTREVGVPVAFGGSERWVQVDAGLIDDLCDAMASISGGFGRIFAQVSQLGSVDRSTSGFGSARQRVSMLIEECTRFRAAVDNATVHTWELRMVPAQPLLRELATHARQLALTVGKVVTVNVDAAGVQIERDALDKVWDAMLHLVRNAVDHGLETAEERGAKSSTGTITISACTVGTSVTLAVTDDGRGIDVERVRRSAITRRLLEPEHAEKMPDDEVVQLVFEHGFSTSEKVGSLSGRGVGLDVVKARAESLGGRVEVQTTKGLGTRFAITLPFTLTKERLIIFELAGGLYALPTQSIISIVGRRDLADATEGSERIARVDGQPVRLRSLAELLGRESEPCGAALIVTLRDQRYGLLVARVVGERELIRRPAEPLLARTTAIGASAMMDDGRVVLMLDLAHVARRLKRSSRGDEATSALRLEPNALPRVLVVDDSPVIREMVSEILVSAGLTVITACDGEDALLRIAEGEPDLVVSDVEMPRMDGFSLLGQIRKRSQRVPVVMLTSRASVQDRQRATTLGANAYVLKADFKSDVLLDVVQRFVPIHR
jgi:chemotaxis protein histidine kinase CheA